MSAATLVGTTGCDVVRLVSPHGGDEPPVVEVELVEMAYRPQQIVIEANTPTRLLLRNGGSLEHDFSVDALRLSPNVRPGEERTVELLAPAGRYRVYCTFPGHEEAGMVGALVVE